MMRVSVLRNSPVICQGKQIGLLQNVNLDMAQKRVDALVISCGIRGKKIAYTDDVKSIADGFILVNSIDKFRRSHKQSLHTFVRDSLGLLTGRVTDYAVSKDGMRIIAVEIRLGYFLPERKIRIWVYDYSYNELTGEMIVPSSLGSGLRFDI